MKKTYHFQMNKTFKISLFLLFLLASASFAFAAPTRVAPASDFFFAYEAPRLSSDGQKFIEKFYLDNHDDKTVYQLTFDDSSDEVLFVSLKGGRIQSLNKDTVNHKTTILFTSPFISRDFDDALYLSLFTNSLFNESAIEPQLKEAMTGAWFDSLYTDVAQRPYFSDEDYNYFIWSFSGFHSSNNKKGSDTLRTFYPAAVLNYLNEGKKILPSQLVLRVFNSGYQITNANTKSIAGGALISIPTTFSASKTAVSVDMNVLPSTGLYVVQKSVVKNSKVELLAYIKNCDGTERISYEKKDSTQTAFRGFANKKVSSSCRAVATFPVSSDTTFRFQYKNKIYSSAISIR